MFMNAVVLFFLLASSSSSRTVGASVPPDIVEVTACDLLGQPLTFANRHVRVRATIETGPEFIGIRCATGAEAQRCIWLDQPADDDTLRYARGWTSQQFVSAARSGAFAGDGPQATWQTPAPLTAPRADFTMGKLSGASVTITGRFDYSADGLLVQMRDGRYAWVAGYGHLNMCPGRLVLEVVDVPGSSR